MKEHIPSEVRFWFNIMVGPPPLNLNLRNIYWHGFASEQEIGRRFTLLLFIFAASVASRLGRPKASFVPICGEALLRRPAATVMEAELVGFAKAVKNSFFVFPGMRHLVLRENLLLMIVVLEQSIRQVRFCVLFFAFLLFFRLL